MKKSTLIVPLCLWFATANAQFISPEVIASSGNSDNIQLNWTVGEVATDTYGNGSHILTQGFHQTSLIVTGVNETEHLSLNVTVFPNPTSDHIVISINGNDRDLITELYDIKGKLLWKEWVPKGISLKEMDMSALATGNYLIKIFSVCNKYLSIYKIQKTSN